MFVEDIAAIVGGYHGDPFGILGPHITENDSGGETWEVRVFLPQAREVFVLTDDAAICAEKRHTQGFYVAALTGAPRRYSIRATLWSGATIDVDDPYRFWPQLEDADLTAYTNGSHFESYRFLGAHPVRVDGLDGVRFAVWAPNAQSVCVTGSFNEWDDRRHPMRMRAGGVWELFMPGVREGATYKYAVRSKLQGYRQQKADPFGFAAELPPKSASVVANIEGYEWCDAGWIEARAQRQWIKEPMSIYEIHLESWLRGPAGQWLSYREIAQRLVAYLEEMRYTHVELLPPMEHPFGGSWGYQVVGYYAPTSRFGSPKDFMFLVDQCHQAGIGVILDWVPAHFPRDAHGLAYFDGTFLYEHADPRKGEHREWGTLIYNYGRSEVKSFLISNALFWLKKYHIDGLRVDAVASMLYLDYSRKHGEWAPNKYGGRENLEAIEFIKLFNEQTHQTEGTFTIAEESTSFPGVTRPTFLGGLGFTMKWNMGWMHDMFTYFKSDPVYRKYQHQNITFSLLYAFSENFVLPVSHDEVVHLKGSLVGKMPGDEWQRFANVRLFLGYMFTHPGKKLLFMGCDFGQTSEWNNEGGLPWHLLQYAPHNSLQRMVRELNGFYRDQPALWQADTTYDGFEWIDFRDTEASVISFLRFAEDRSDFLVVCCNFTPVPRGPYAIGVPHGGIYHEVFNTDAGIYGGGNIGNAGRTDATASPAHGRSDSISVMLPPLAMVVFRPSRTN